jgi:hypothetical protein
MKIKGQQTLSRQEQKLLSDLANRFGKSFARKGDRTWEKHASNIRTIAREMARMGYQKVSDFKLKTYTTIMTHQKELGSSKPKLESLHSTMQYVSKAVGKEGMIAKSVAKAMGSKDYHRSTEDRIKPQRWVSAESRQQAQDKLEARNQRYASAADMARHFGLRKEEALASREIIVKTAEGKFYTTAGSKNAGELREVNMRGVRYAITDNKKDTMFERNYLETMRPGQEYLIVKGDWSKNARTRLVPVLNETSRTTAIRHQALIRDNIALAMSLGRSNVDSIIHPALSKEQGYNQFTKELEKVGLTRNDKGHTLHADRCEFNLRMKAEKNEDVSDKWSKHERTLAMGHCDDRKLASYGG